ncbi:putative bifunctional diguanylate cyclase/phosphodiesterase [Demequina iriomotensis]|uniref:putative bifunctional diguanylate cyclase/phosphodiesterase n=1 Tax=Demequina iriomotensis TaxID=1536641 RepID=UPI000784D22D|nr:bifunctional diguanylate cyclase/phosphodiesterase [Demequina iriomotensis]
MGIRIARPTRLDAYVTAVAVAGIAAALACLVPTPWVQVWDAMPVLSVAVLLLAAIAGEWKPIILHVSGNESRAIGISAPFVLALVPIAGVAVAIVVQVVAGAVADVRRGAAPHKAVFNVGQNALNVLVAGVVYAGLTGTELIGVPADVDHWRVLALLVAGAAMVASNDLLVSIAVSLATGRRLAELIRQDIGLLAVTQVVLLSVAGVAAEAAHHGAFPLILLAGPVAAAHAFAAMGVRHAHDARHDLLTGLGNRAHLHLELRSALGGGARAAALGPGLVLVDLDNFKDFNDALGHPVGDAILCEVAARLVSAAPETASVHRLGGDEFAVVVHGGLVETQQIARCLLDSFAAPVRVDELELLVRGSAGVAVAPLHGHDDATLMKNADIALYHAKLERDRVSTYSREFAVNTVDRLRLLVDLRAAVEGGDLDVAYQPQIDLATGRIVAVEALARWNHPERGPVGPDEFVPLAEDSGLIYQLTGFVLDRALADVATWRARGHDLRLAVNLSARHLSDLALPSTVRAALERHGVPATALVLEITETAIFSDRVRADVVLRSLRDLGIAIAIDDYGTGNASLNYLRRLRIDELKIDRSFVAGVGADPHDLIIVRSTVELALALGLRVVAEGIEDAATGEAVRALGDVIGQGYHYSSPVSAAAFGALIEAEATREAARA